MDNLITVRKEKKASIGEAALTMAVGIIVERIGRLSTEDQEELYELVKGLRETTDPDEVEAIRVAMLEILDQEAGELVHLEDTISGERPEKLAKWNKFVATMVEAKRKRRGMTQTELADKSGLPQSHISRIESAKLSPSRATLEKLAKALGCDLNELDPSA